MASALFVDGSVNPQMRVGFGAYYVIKSHQLDRARRPTGSDASITDSPLDTLLPGSAPIQLRRFEQTSSTQLELEALLWALEQHPVGETITVYTDCQNVVGLPARRRRLEAKNFCSAKGEPLALAALYRRFFEHCDNQTIAFIKLEGHKPANQRTVLDQLFSRVDRAARQACKSLRAEQR